MKEKDGEERRKEKKEERERGELYKLNWEKSVYFFTYFHSFLWTFDMRIEIFWVYNYTSLPVCHLQEE